jgi:hypothetical protein
MKNSWLLVIAVLLVMFSAACKSKPKTLAGDEAVTPEEFIEFFPEISLPFSIADTSISKKNNDSSVIGNNIFSQIVGDSVMRAQFGTKVKPKIYPIGRVAVKKAETYIFVKAISPAKKGVYVLAFDKDKVFRAALPMLVQDADPQTSQSASMDTRYTISQVRQRRKADGQVNYRKDAYVYNNIGVYTLILTESNEDVAVSGDVVNPLDTLARKHKYSGDYNRDKRNLVSIRDGRNSSLLRFFVHFEKDKGTCRGEIKGEATFVQPNVAVFRESGDPCVLEFRFTANAVSIREVEGCGNYRDIKCFFEGSFPRKKEPKPKVKKK